MPPNHEVTLCVLLLMFGVIVTHGNCAVFPNIMGGFAIIHSTVDINEKQNIFYIKKVDIFVIHDSIHRPSYRVVRDKISLYTGFNMQLIYLHL